MFLNIFLFEIKYRLKRPATWLYFAIFFLFAFTLMTTDKIKVGQGTANVFLNAPAQVETLIVLFMAFGMLVISAIMGNPVYRDYEHRTHHFLFSYPFGKWEYLLGRFFGSFVICCIVFLSLPLGIAVGASLAPALGWMPADRFCSNSISTYLVPYLAYIIPNTLFVGAIFFGITSLSKKITYTYMFNVMFLMGYLMALNGLTEPENMHKAAILDPFGLITQMVAKRYWTSEDLNTRIFGFQGIVVWNRLLWMTVGLVIFGISGYFFDYRVKNKQSPKLLKNKDLLATPHAGALPQAQLSFGGLNQFKQMWSYAWVNFRDTIREVPFIGIVVSGLVFIIGNIGQEGKIFGTSTYPVSYNVLETTNGLFGLFMLIILTYYGGEWVWKERELKMNQLYDAFPIKNWVLFGSKILTAWMVVITIKTGILAVSVIFQAIKGGAPINWSLYLWDLYCLSLIGHLFLAVLAIFVQTISPNKFTGHAIMLLYYVWVIVCSSIGFEHRLFSLLNMPRYMYSDMNGFGPSWYKISVFAVCWGFFVMMLLIIGNLLWVRGTVSSWKERLQILKKRIKGKPAIMLAFAFVGFLTTAGFIVYNTNVINQYITDDDIEKEAVRYEKDYRIYKNLPQPKFIGVTVEMDLYPKELRYTARGMAKLQNKTSSPIDTLFLSYNQLAKKMELNGIGKLVMDDKKMGIRFYVLDTPLMPQDSITMKYDIEIANQGIANRSQVAKEIVYNGTFIHNTDYFPSLGYREDLQLRDKNKRKEYQLPVKPELPEPGAKEGLHDNPLNPDADWMTFECVVGTEADQIAIAPGYLIKEETRGGRKYFHYKMDALIENFYAVVSARYEVLKENWNGISLEIYYHKGHDYNLRNMMKGMKDAITYASENFSPYQYRQARIIEFPRYEMFAQSFPNTIPFSEGMGFIADLRDSSEIDYAYYVTAHEIAHQWWGHQVLPSAQKGATMLVETMAQYTALMVMKKEYGPEKMRQFLKFELDSYLSRRGSEGEYELPLYRTTGQDYIHYRKGSVVMYALQDYWGEENLNRALHKFVMGTRYQTRPYPHSVSFLDTLKRYTPDSLQYLYKDMFEQITLYDNRTLSAVSEKLPNGKYKVILEIEGHKQLADSLGKETPLPLNDYIDIAVLGAETRGKYSDKQLYIQKHRIHEGKNTFEVVVDEEPKKAGIDVYNKLIDRDSDDNLMRITPK